MFKLSELGHAADRKSRKFGETDARGVSTVGERAFGNVVLSVLGGGNCPLWPCFVAKAGERVSAEARDV
jgi:hypothetical protein